LNGEPQETAIGIQEQMPLVSPELQQRYLQRDWRLTALHTVHSGFGGGDYVYRKLTRSQEELALALIESFSLRALMKRWVHELSTGELRRVLIARALVSVPPVLICDEICDGLDPESRAAILQILNQAALRGTQLIYATHRTEELLPVLTHCLVLQHGRIIKQGPVGYRRAQRQGSAQHKRLPQSSRTEFDTRQVWIKPKRRAGSSRPLVEIERANVFLNGRKVLFDVHWALRAGEHWAVVGPNGAGKSTLLKLIHGDVHPALGGCVRRFEYGVRDSIWPVKARIGFVSPELQARYAENFTGEEVVASGWCSSIGRIGPVMQPLRRRLAELLDAMDLRRIARKPVSQMSYGEFRKILLARALVRQPDILLLDEPLDGLDLPTRVSMRELLNEIGARGTSLLIASHHPNDLPRCITHVAQVMQGRIVKQGAVAR
jgi:molybdate transport system ATP-binding protein